MSLPALGFGTAPMLGRESRARSLAAIEAALAAGVRHFDTARSYGWGEAEGLLGEALKAVPREELTIVSKCGIVPVRRTRALGAAKAVARGLMGFAPGLVRRAASSAGVQPSRSYDLGVLDASLRTSLAQLRTDYLDVLLLHNFDPRSGGIESVTEWMRGLQAAGTIRRYGFAVGPRLTEALEWLDAHGLREGAIVQAPLGIDMVRLPAKFREQELFVHSVFRGNARQDLRALGKLLAASSNCRAIIASMFSPEHIRANAAALRG